MTAASKNVYNDKLDEIIDKYKNTFHRKIKIKPANVKSGIYIDHCVEHNDKDPKFKVTDHVRISR